MTEIVTYLESDLPKCVISGPASSKTTFALHVTGPFTSRECRNIIRLIELHREWLEEDERAAGPKAGNPAPADGGADA